MMRTARCEIRIEIALFLSIVRLHLVVLKSHTLNQRKNCYKQEIDDKNGLVFSSLQCMTTTPS